MSKTSAKPIRVVMSTAGVDLRVNQGTRQAILDETTGLELLSR